MQITNKFLSKFGDWDLKNAIPRIKLQDKTPRNTLSGKIIQIYCKRKFLELNEWSSQKYYYYGRPIEDQLKTHCKPRRLIGDPLETNAQHASSETDVPDQRPINHAWSRIQLGLCRASIRDVGIRLGMLVSNQAFQSPIRKVGFRWESN